MSGDAFLRVGSVAVSYDAGGSGFEELVAVFTDDMFLMGSGQQPRPAPGASGAGAEAELRAAGRIVADRLNVMGMDRGKTLADLDSMLQN
jgi:hypothetical protein